MGSAAPAPRNDTVSQISPGEQARRTAARSMSKRTSGQAGAGKIEYNRSLTGQEQDEYSLPGAAAEHATSGSGGNPTFVPPTNAPPPGTNPNFSQPANAPPPGTNPNFTPPPGSATPTSSRGQLSLSRIRDAFNSRRGQSQTGMPK